MTPTAPDDLSNEHEARLVGVMSTEHPMKKPGGAGELLEAGVG